MNVLLDWFDDKVPSLDEENSIKQGIFLLSKGIYISSFFIVMHYVK